MEGGEEGGGTHLYDRVGDVDTGHASGEGCTGVSICNICDELQANLARIERPIERRAKRHLLHRPLHHTASLEDLAKEAGQDAGPAARAREEDTVRRSMQATRVWRCVARIAYTPSATRTHRYAPAEAHGSDGGCARPE